MTESNDGYLVRSKSLDNIVYTDVGWSTDKHSLVAVDELAEKFNEGIGLSGL